MPNRSDAFPTFGFSIRSFVHFRVYPLQDPRIDHDSQIFVYEYLGKELEDYFGAAALTEFGRLSLLVFKPRAYREAWRGMEGPIAGTFEWWVGGEISKDCT